MGADKALVEVDGKAMAARVARALADGGCDPVVCQGGDAEALAALGLVVVADSNPGGGPVTGILDALSATTADIVVSACDLPWLDSATVRALLEGASTRFDADAVVASEAGRPQLLGLWRASARERLAELVAGGVRSYRGVLERLDTAAVEVPAAVVANVNSPADLRRRR